MSLFLRRRVTFAALFAALALLLHGCGSGHGTAPISGVFSSGSNGGSSGGTNGGSGSGTNGGNNGGGTGTALSDQTRTAALDAVAAAYDALPQTSATDDAAAMLAFIRTRPEFSASGIARDNSVWALFTDNRSLVITLNDFPSKTSKATVPPSLTRALTRSDNGSPEELPGSNKFYLVNTRERNDPAVTRAFDKLENEYLPPNSYQPIVIDGTIEGLKNIKNAGVLYNIGHAGLGYKGMPQNDFATNEYVFGTLDEQSAAGDATYRAELDSGEVGYTLEPTLIDRLNPLGAPLARYKMGKHYFITDAFVRKYWTFAPNSFFVSDNCDGATDEASAFRQACFDSGLSAYLGWDNAVANSNANESALFLFDRMLGNNDQSAALQPENPHQRAFNYFAVLDQMATLPRQTGSIPGLTLTSSFSVDSVGYGLSRSGKAFLKDFRNQADGKGNAGLLSPTISAAYIDERNHQVVLSGIFGSDPGSDSHAVTIDGEDMTGQTKWTYERLTINNIPTDGPGSSGDIEVNVRGHLSNKVQITEWRGKFLAAQQGNGDERLVAVFDAHFRAILNFLRVDPGKMPVPPIPGGKVSISSAPDTTCVIDAYGTDKLPTIIETVAVAGDTNVPVAPGEPQNPNRYATLNATIDENVSPPKLHVGATVYVYDNDNRSGLKVTTNDSDVGTPHSFVYAFKMAASGEHTNDFTGQLGDNYDILAGSFDSMTSEFHRNFTINWLDMVAVHPPTTNDASASRSVKRRRK